MMNLKQTIMQRDGLCETDWDDLIESAREEFVAGIDPEDILHDLFGLEPDYIFDLMEYIP